MERPEKTPEEIKKYWADKQPYKYFSFEYPAPHWDQKILPINLTNLSFLGVDSMGHLHWDGDRINTEVRLSFWQRLGAFVITGSAAVGAAGAFLSGLADWLGK